MISPVQEALQSVGRTVRDTLVFSGRSRVRDVIYFAVATGLISFPADVALRDLLSWDSAVVARACLNALLALPFFALCVRRLHDQDRTGWWAMVLPPLMVSSAYDLIHTSFAIFDPSFMENASRSEPWRWLLLPLALAVFVFTFLPGSVGANRYGPDPREDGEGAVKT